MSLMEPETRHGAAFWTFLMSFTFVPAAAGAGIHLEFFVMGQRLAQPSSVSKYNLRTICTYLRHNFSEDLFWPPPAT